MELSALDYGVFALYCVAVLAVGWWVARKEKTSQDYFLAGRRLPWYAIGFSLIATSISTEQFIGEVGFAYRHGLAVANWEWGVFPAMTVMILFFVPFYVRRQISTMPEWLEHRFGPSTRMTLAVIMVLSYVFINLAGRSVRRRPGPARDLRHQSVALDHHAGRGDGGVHGDGRPARRRLERRDPGGAAAGLGPACLLPGPARGGGLGGDARHGRPGAPDAARQPSGPALDRHPRRDGLDEPVVLRDEPVHQPAGPGRPQRVARPRRRDLRGLSRPVPGAGRMLPGPDRLQAVPEPGEPATRRIRGSSVTWSARSATAFAAWSSPGCSGPSCPRSTP